MASGTTKNISPETALKMTETFSKYFAAVPVIYGLFSACSNEDEIKLLIDGLKDSGATNSKLNFVCEDIFNGNMDDLKECIIKGYFEATVEEIRQTLRQD